ncbi:MAG TPA: tRNA (5-methylaminomethyl-2-thiouridine)(34)-methyltransferase MnmD [Methylotenera sp.]|nr:tRNA (5-methylaminomethyl-2-thiouridine)(34)-methyltransferase MnmD [Methylotenera sp.]
MHNLTPSQAKIEWRDGQPYASAFQDVYFSSDDGLLETEYVFLQGNNLISRWQQPDLHVVNQNVFTIAETGFGTGLNFLCAAKLWLKIGPKDTKLHFISTEKYPLSLQDMTNALAYWPDLNLLTLPFLAQYQTMLDKKEPVLLFNDRVQLTLLIGDATTHLNDIQTKVDAWFLDGFAPSKNPEMWQAALFEQMARLSNDQTTFATFTSAGDVRRGLTTAGFEVNKRAGFGKKREMLMGRFLNNKK